MRIQLKALLVVLSAAAAFGALLWAIPLSRSSAHPLWLLTLWLSALGLCVLLTASSARRNDALVAWALAAPLALLAEGSAQLPISILVVAGFLIGAANLLGVPMYVPELIVTDLDVERLQRLLDALPPRRREAARGLEAELARAQVVASTAIPRDVVTMNSRVVFEEIETGKSAEAVLVYPHDSDGNGYSISVLAPVGTALLGLRAGQCIDWPMPTGRCKRIRVRDVKYQPEAAGDFHL
jgi:regulator of nucleoside diphosphate kinase